MLERIVVAYEKTVKVPTCIPAIVIEETTYIFVDGQFKCRTSWAKDWLEYNFPLQTIVGARTLDENIELFRGLTWLLEQAKTQGTAK